MVTSGQLSDNEISQLEKLDQFSMLALMGMNNLSKKDTDNLLYDMSKLITGEFISFKVVPMLTNRQREVLAQLLEDEEPIELILQFLMKAIPNYVEHMADFTREKKVEYLRKHFLTEISRLQKECELFREDADRMGSLEKKIEKCRNALGLIDDYSWDALQLLMAS